MSLVFFGLLNCLGLGHMVDACGGIAFQLSTIAMYLVYPVLSQQRRLVLRNPAKIVAGPNQSMDISYGESNLCGIRGGSLCSSQSWFLSCGGSIDKTRPADRPGASVTHEVIPPRREPYEPVEVENYRLE